MPVSTLSGGAFQDPLGNAIANGTLILELSAPATDVLTGEIQICTSAVSFLLDVEGNVASTPTPTLWANNSITPTNTYYMARVYAKSGQLAWGPNAVYANQSGGVINLSSWTPINPY